MTLISAIVNLGLLCSVEEELRRRPTIYRVPGSISSNKINYVPIPSLKEAFHLPKILRIRRRLKECRKIGSLKTLISAKVLFRYSGKALRRLDIQRCFSLWFNKQTFLCGSAILFIHSNSRHHIAKDLRTALACNDMCGYYSVLNNHLRGAGCHRPAWSLDFIRDSKANLCGAQWCACDRRIKGQSSHNAASPDLNNLNLPAGPEIALRQSNLLYLANKASYEACWYDGVSDEVERNLIIGDVGLFGRDRQLVSASSMFSMAEEHVQ